MAGMHKHKWSYTVKYAPDHFGSNMWHPPNQVITEKWINLNELGGLQSQGEVIDLVALGYDKLLGEGTVHGALKVKALRAHSSAIEKIKAAGGSIEVLEVKVVKEKPAKPEAKGKHSVKSQLRNNISICLRNWSQGIKSFPKRKLIRRQTFGRIVHGCREELCKGCSHGAAGNSQACQEAVSQRETHVDGNCTSRLHGHGGHSPYWCSYRCLESDLLLQHHFCIPTGDVDDLGNRSHRYGWPDSPTTCRL